MRYQVRTTREKLPEQFLQVLNGKNKLTDGEIKLVGSIILLYQELDRDGVKEPSRSKLVFSADGRKAISGRVGEMSAQNFNNKLKQLVDKKILAVVPGGYMLPTALMPVPELTFEFIVVD